MTWMQKGLGLIGLGICLIALFVAGLFLYIGATATPLTRAAGAFSAAAARSVA